MGTTTADVLIERARRLLQDRSSVAERWSDADLLDALNEGQLALVQIKPDAYTETVSMQLAAEAIQSLPSDAVSIIRVVRNMGTGAGDTPGRAITQTTLLSLDTSDPNWYSLTPSAVSYQYAVDDRDDSRFYIYPPSDGTGFVQIVYAKAPEEIPNTATAITLNDVYAPALVQYICYSAMSQDMDSQANAQLAQAFFAQFNALVLGKSQGEILTSPNTNEA